jgi:hypothetical protein
LQLGVFYGRSELNKAGHTGFLTIDEARQMAIDFARPPQLVYGRGAVKGSDHDERTEAATGAGGATAMTRRDSVTIEIATDGNSHTAAVFRGRTPSCGHSSRPRTTPLLNRENYLPKLMPPSRIAA